MDLNTHVVLKPWLAILQITSRASMLASNSKLLRKQHRPIYLCLDEVSGSLSKCSASNLVLR